MSSFLYMQILQFVCSIHHLRTKIKVLVRTLFTFSPFYMAMSLLFSTFVGTLQAQDIHFSQFGNSPLNLNPGLAGVFGGDMRFVGNYRNQWRSVPVPYNTFSGTVENKFYHKRRSNNYRQFFTGGLQLNYDKQGSLSLESWKVSVPLGYTHAITSNNFLTVGVMPAFGGRQFGNNNLTFDEQFVDCFFDPNAAISEQLSGNSLRYFTLGAGWNLRTQAPTKRSKLDIGMGIHHLNRPYHDFWSRRLAGDPGTVRLAQRLAFYGLGTLQVSHRTDLVGQVQLQQQGGYQEIVYGLAGRFHLNTTPYKELSLQAGVDVRHRYSDAVVAHLEGHWKTWTLGFTYDINLNNDRAWLTQGRGGPEVALIYRLFRVKPLPFDKSCKLL